MTYQPWEFTAEFAPGFSPITQPTSSDWDPLGDLREVHISRGRQDDLDAFEAGTMELVVDNAAETLDHLLSSSTLYDTSALPFTPVRLVATRGIDVRVIFTGYTLDGFSPVGNRGAGTVTTTVVDWMGWAKAVEAPGSLWDAWATYCKPTVWMNGLTTRTYSNYDDNPDGVAWNAAAAFQGAVGDFYPDATYPSYVYRLTTSIVTGSSHPSLYLGDTPPGTTFGGMTMDGGDSLTQVGRWMAAGWFNAVNAQTLTWGGSDWSVSLNASGYLVATVDVGGSSEVETISVDHADSANHLWVLKVNSTGSPRFMTLESDLGVSTHTFGAAAVSGGGVLNFRGLGFYESTVGDFVYWDDQTQLASVFAASDGYGGGATVLDGPTGGNVLLWSGDTMTERLPRIFDACAIDQPDTELALETNHVVAYMFESVPATLADWVTELGTSYLGAAYILRDGTLRVRDASLTNKWQGFGVSRDYAFTLIEAAISDDSAATEWTATVSDAFTRANANTITSGNTAWFPGFNVLDGAIGITSNTAYVYDSSATENLIYFQVLGRDVTVECDFTTVEDGMGVVVRHSGYGNYITVARSFTAATVDVIGWVDGVGTTIGTTGADNLGSNLIVTTDDDTITVQIDGGTIHTFTITDPTHMAGAGVGLAFTEIGVLPASTARWDNFTASCTRPLIRPENRSRTGYRSDRVINQITVDYSAGTDIYYQDADSIRRYGARPVSFASIADGSTGLAALEGYVQDLLAARKDPTIEVGEITLHPWGNQYVTDWVIRDLELERAVTYREALYKAGTEVLDATYRVTGEKWDLINGVDWTVTLRLVPA